MIPPGYAIITSRNTGKIKDFAVPENIVTQDHLG